MHVDANTILSFLMLAVVLFAGPRWLKAERWKAQDQEKEKMVVMKQEIINTLEDRLNLVREDKDRAITDAQDAKRILHLVQLEKTELQAKYDEQSQYTAKEAFTLVAQLLDRHEMEAEARHREMVEVLTRLTPERRKDNHDAQP